MLISAWFPLVGLTDAGLLVCDEPNKVFCPIMLIGRRCIHGATGMGAGLRRPNQVICLNKWQRRFHSTNRMGCSFFQF